MFNSNNNQQFPQLSFLSAQEFNNYKSLYLQANPTLNGVNSMYISKILDSTNLPQGVINRIESLSNISKNGYYNFPQFCLLMKLLNGRMSGETLPNSLPDSIAKEVISASNSMQKMQTMQTMQTMQNMRSPTSPATSFFGNNSSSNTSNFSTTSSSSSNSVWTLTNEEKMKYYDIFKQYDTFNSGFLKGDVIRGIFQKSNLAIPMLSRIYDLVDQRRTGSLSKIEFAVGMLLINRQMRGITIPSQLPYELKEVIKNNMPMQNSFSNNMMGGGMNSSFNSMNNGNNFMNNGMNNMGGMNNMNNMGGMNNMNNMGGMNNMNNMNSMNNMNNMNNGMNSFSSMMNNNNNNNNNFGFFNNNNNNNSNNNNFGNQMNNNNNNNMSSNSFFNNNNNNNNNSMNQNMFNSSNPTSPMANQNMFNNNDIFGSNGGVQIEEVSANYEEEEEKKKEIEKFNEEIAKLEAQKEHMIQGCKSKIGQLNQQLQKLNNIEEKFNNAFRDYNNALDSVRRSCDDRRNVLQEEVNKHKKKDESATIENKAQELLAKRMEALGLSMLSTLPKGDDDEEAKAKRNLYEFDEKVKKINQMISSSEEKSNRIKSQFQEEFNRQKEELNLLINFDKPSFDINPQWEKGSNINDNDLYTFIMKLNQDRNDLKLKFLKELESQPAPAPTPAPVAPVAPAVAEPQENIFSKMAADKPADLFNAPAFTSNASEPTPTNETGDGKDLNTISKDTVRNMRNAFNQPNAFSHTEEAPVSKIKDFIPSSVSIKDKIKGMGTDNSSAAAPPAPAPAPAPAAAPSFGSAPPPPPPPAPVTPPSGAVPPPPPPPPATVTPPNGSAPPPPPPPPGPGMAPPAATSPTKPTVSTNPLNAAKPKPSAGINHNDLLKAIALRGAMMNNDMSDSETDTDASSVYSDVTPSSAPIKKLPTPTSAKSNVSASFNQPPSSEAQKPKIDMSSRIKKLEGLFKYGSSGSVNEDEEEETTQAEVSTPAAPPAATPAPPAPPAVEQPQTYAEPSRNYEPSQTYPEPPPPPAQETVEDATQPSPVSQQQSETTKENEEYANEELMEESDDESFASDDYVYDDEFYILYYVKALYDFNSENPNDLPFQKSAIIAVYQEKDEWLSGNHNGRIGWFPKNYVQVIKNDDEDEEEQSNTNNYSSSSNNYNQSGAYQSSLYPATSTSNLSAMGYMSKSNTNLSYSVSKTSWAATVDPSVLNSIDESERMRQEVIFELIKTEQSYVRDLQVIVNEFLIPIQNQRILNDGDIKMIFLNIEEILDCNALLLSSLESAQDNNNYVETVGHIFRQHSFDCYSYFCSSLTVSLKYLQSLREEKKPLKNFLKDQMSNPECKQLDLSSFLLEPMQRITRYSLLLKQILHYTGTNHRDHDDVLQALRTVEERVEKINEKTRDFENQDKINTILKLVDFHNTKLDLYAPSRFVDSRRFILEGPLAKAKSGRKLYVYLFNDLILFTQLKSNSARTMTKGTKYWVYRKPLFINEISLQANPMGKNKMKKEICFQIFHTNGVITLKAPNPSEKSRWVDALKRVLNEYRDTDKERKSRARNPKNFKSKFIGTLQVSLEGREIYVHENDINLFCDVNLNKQNNRTVYSHDVPNPSWRQPLIFEVQNMQDILKITLINFDYSTNQELVLGDTSFPLSLLEMLDDSGHVELALENTSIGGEIIGSIKFKPY